MAEALRRPWPEYLMEAAGRGLFMIAACFMAALLERPGSPLHTLLSGPISMRALITSTAPWARR